MQGYHGSAAGNIHSILHNGLENMSGTANENKGAVFGDGIYLARALQVAQQFAPFSRSWRRRGASLRGANSVAATRSISCVVACDVVKAPGVVNRLQRNNESKGDYYVVASGML